MNPLKKTDPQPKRPVLWTAIALLAILVPAPSLAEESHDAPDPARLEARIIDRLFPDKTPSKPLPFTSKHVEAMIDQYHCPRLKQVFLLLQSFRDESVKQAHSGRSTYLSGTYDIKLFSADNFRERVDKYQYWHLKDGDYFDWLRAGYLDVPPEPRNGFKSQGPALQWVKEKFQGIIHFEIAKCEKSKPSGE